MPTVFPANNLSREAQPWAREVTKYLSSLISTTVSNQINNASRDNQLNSSIIALNAVVKDVKTAASDAAAAADEANAAINGLIGLGSAGGEYTLNASNIVGGTISGVNFITTGGTESLSLSSGKINFFQGASAIGSMTADSDGSNNYIQIQSSGILGSLTIGSFYSVLSGQSSAVQVGAFASGRIDLTGSLVFCNAQLSVNSSVFFTGLSTTTNAANMRVATVGARQVFEVTSSSKKYKNTITPIFEVQDINEDKLLDLPVVGFKYNEDYLNNNDYRFDKMVPGFIAEQLYEVYPIAAEMEEGQPIDWNPRFIIPGMLALIQKLNQRITTLENGAN